MKKLLAVALLLSSVAQAADLVLVDVPSSQIRRSEKLTSKIVVMDSVPYVRFNKTRVETVGPRNGQVRFVNSSYHMVEGLELFADKLVYTSAEGQVDCGTMVKRDFGGPRTSIFRKVLKLNGNCRTEVKSVNTGIEDRVQVIFSI